MTARVLIIDIERLKGRAEVEFFDLNDYKNRRIHPDEVQEWPRTICAAWKFQGDRKVEFAAEWEEGGVAQMAAATHAAYDEADIVVGHNIDGFDTRKLNSLWIEQGLTVPSPRKSVDTLKVARGVFGMESNTLNALCVRLGITAKTDRYDHEVARRACAGVVKDQRKLRRYNVGDIGATEALYNHFLGWQKNPPNAALWSGDKQIRCVACGKTNLQLRGEQVALAQVYDRYQCQDCGKWGKGLEIVRRIGGLRNA